MATAKRSKLEGASKIEQGAEALPTKRKGHWSQGLVSSMEDPDMIVESDDRCIIIKDAYPKAKCHYLVLSKSSISSLRALDTSHVDLLTHMLHFGKDFVKREKAKHPTLEFRLGYHAVPSMSRLHMHVISQDFDSPCLKNKKHWNSFTTDFFVDANEVIDRLKSKGVIVFDKARYEELLKLPLKCHVCHRELQNMPKLKDHIRSHIK